MLNQIWLFCMATMICMSEKHVRTSNRNHRTLEDCVGRVTGLENEGKREQNGRDARASLPFFFVFEPASNPDKVQIPSARRMVSIGVA